MNSTQIYENVIAWAQSKNFTAPYGVIYSELTNKKGTKYKAVTFGRARTLDCTVEIYNRNFMIVLTNRHGYEVFNSFDEMMKFLETI